MKTERPQLNSGRRQVHYARRSGRQLRASRFLMMIALICILTLFIRGRIFVVREIEVTGNLQKSASEIAGQSGLMLGMSIFNVDKSSVERNLSVNNYVELLDVRTEMPDTVVLEIRERVPCAAVNCAGVIMLVDEDGYILERMTGIPREQGIIVVSGINAAVGSQSRWIESGTAGQIEVMQKVLRAIREAELEGQVSELNVSNQDNLYLISQSGIQVLFGDEEMLAEKLIWMRAVLETLTADGYMSGVLDVSSGKNAVYAQ